MDWAQQGWSSPLLCLWPLSISLAMQQSHTTRKDSQLNPFLEWDQEAGWEVAAATESVIKLLPSYRVKETGT